MGLLYKKPKDTVVSVEIKQKDGIIELLFTSDCGKFGTDECLAEYRLTPAMLLDVLRSTEKYSNDELI